jgi:Ca2+-transporting ATPase
MVKNTDLVVGDVYLVNMGDKVVADGIMIDGFHLVIDEASLTGEMDSSNSNFRGLHSAFDRWGWGEY